MSTSIEVGNARLLKLAEFLETKVPRKHFDIQTLSTTGNVAELRSALTGGGSHYCGTAACGLGWCPVLFPRAWKMNVSEQPVLRDSAHYDEPFLDADRFFQIEPEESAFLFAGYHTDNTTPKRLAAKIRRFVAARTAK